MPHPTAQDSSCGRFKFPDEISRWWSATTRGQVAVVGMRRAVARWGRRWSSCGPRTVDPPSDRTLPAPHRQQWCRGVECVPALPRPPAARWSSALRYVEGRPSPSGLVAAARSPDGRAARVVTGIAPTTSRWRWSRAARPGARADALDEVVGLRPGENRATTGPMGPCGSDRGVPAHRQRYCASTLRD